MQHPLVSVVIPTYERSDFIQRAIESVVNQSYKNVEILVVDDNDPDTVYRKQTEKKIIELQKKYKNIKYIKHDKNKGGSAARNNGVQYAAGEYIAFLDDDDTFLPLKIEKQLDFLISNKLDMVFCYSILSKDENTKIYKPKFADSKNYIKYLLVYNFIGTQTILCTKKSILKINGFDESLQRCQDWDLAIRFSLKCKIGCIKLPLVVVDINKHQRITNRNKDHTEIIYRKYLHYAKRFDVLFLVLLHCIKNLYYKRFNTYIKNVWINKLKQ